MNELKRFYEIYIKSDAEKIWNALTQGEFTQQYFHSTVVESDWIVGSKVVYRMPDNSDAVIGNVIEVDLYNRLVITWNAVYSDELAAEGYSTVTFEINKLDEGVCKLSVSHTDFVDNSLLYEHVKGWVAIISSLKSLLETGKALPITPE